VAVNVEVACGVEVGLAGIGLLSSVGGVESSTTLAPLQPADKKIAIPNPTNKIIQRKARSRRGMFGFISGVDRKILPSSSFI
jgi:hypothetical protein